MMERQPWTLWTDCKLLRRFQDELPQHTPPVLHGQHSGVASPSASETSPVSSSSSTIQRVFTSAKSIFGLFCWYQSATPPMYEPDDHLTIKDLSSITLLHKPSQETPLNYYPYPNQSSFLLGDWFWNGGVTKSQGSFDTLMDIISDADFHQDDVCNVNWDHINNTLSADDANEWLDDDAGWTSTPVSVSFQPRWGVPSSTDARARDYVVREFCHRKLVSVIKEKITSLQVIHHFHYEPYELLWHPPHMPNPICIQGKLYSSPAFLHAHQELQNSPNEPGCKLLRCVIALMFSSDLTHLTAFGDAKLWPLYLFLAIIQSIYAVSQQVTYVNMLPILSREVHHVSSSLFIQWLRPCSSQIPSRNLPQVRQEEAVHPPLHSQRIALGSSCMNSGKFCLMMSSWKHGSMALSFCALMGFCDGSIREFSPIQQTIWKSEFQNLTFWVNFTVYQKQDTDCKHPQSWQVPLSPLFDTTIPGSQPWNGKGHVAKEFTGLHQ